MRYRTAAATTRSGKFCLGDILQFAHQAIGEGYSLSDTVQLEFDFDQLRDRITVEQQ